MFEVMRYSEQDSEYRTIHMHGRRGVVSKYCTVRTTIRTTT